MAAELRLFSQLSHVQLDSVISLGVLVDKLHMSTGLVSVLDVNLQSYT